MRTRIAGGRVIDPANGRDAVGDVWISDGRIIDAPPAGTAADATPLSTAGWSTFETGCRYAQMGFTTVVEPAVLPHYALHAHLELADIPIVDKATLAVLGNDDFLLGLMHAREGASA